MSTELRPKPEKLSSELRICRCASHTAALSRALSRRNDLKPIMLTQAAMSVEAFTGCNLRLITPDDYVWFSALEFQVNCCTVVVLIPWMHRSYDSWSRTCLWEAQRGIEVYAAQGVRSAIPRLLNQLTRAVQEAEVHLPVRW